MDLLLVKQLSRKLEQKKLLELEFLLGEGSNILSVDRVTGIFREGIAITGLSRKILQFLTIFLS